MYAADPHAPTLEFTLVCRLWHRPPDHTSHALSACPTLTRSAPAASRPPLWLPLLPPPTSTVARSVAHRDILSDDIFELQELHKPTTDRQRAKRESNRERKRREKLEQLRAADEMKFSHSLQFNAVPDWSSHYISYSNLKKLYVSLPRQPGPA